MKNNLSLWQFSGFSLTSLLGTLLHFVYDWTNKSLLIAPFSAVNESTWEHLKLLFFPFFLFALVQYRFFKGYKNFWCIKLVGVLTGLISIPVLFYTYNGAIAKSPDWLNIAFFFISAALSFLIEWYLFKRSFISSEYSKICFYSFLFIGVLFVIFTFWTPRLAIFKDPVTNTFGIN